MKGKFNLKKILLIDGVYPVNTRNLRIYKTLMQKYTIKFCAWNRNNFQYTDKNNFIYSSNEGYGKKIKKLLGMKAYLSFIKQTIKEYKPELIIASQWDMLLLTILSGFKGKIIYENLDLPTSSNKFILLFLLKLEKWMLKKIDGIIFASRFFLPIYKENNIKKLLLENLPLKEINFQKEIDIQRRNKIRISFIGGLRYFETMKNLLLAIQKNNNIELYLIGRGAENNKFKNFIKEKKLKNILLIDSYKYEEIKKFYVNTDLIWAVYPNKDYNVKFAISNKFFESILFEKPCFFAKNTQLGNLVHENGMGIVVDPYNIQEIKNIINQLNKEKILNLQNNIKFYKNNQKLYWEESEEELLKFIKNIEK